MSKTHASRRACTILFHSDACKYKWTGRNILHEVPAYHVQSMARLSRRAARYHLAVQLLDTMIAWMKVHMSRAWALSGSTQTCIDACTESCDGRVDAVLGVTWACGKSRLPWLITRFSFCSQFPKHTSSTWAVIYNCDWFTAPLIHTIQLRYKLCSREIRDHVDRKQVSLYTKSILLAYRCLRIYLVRERRH